MAWSRRPGGVALALAAVGLVVYGSLPSAASSEERFVKKTVAKHEIVIFSKSYCPFCKKAKSVFKELNKEPFVIELDERGTVKNQYLRSDDQIARRYFD